LKSLLLALLLCSQFAHADKFVPDPDPYGNAWWLVWGGEYPQLFNTEAEALAESKLRDMRARRVYLIYSLGKEPLVTILTKVRRKVQGKMSKPQRDALLKYTTELRKYLK
jgi:hypothetical protein